jgi:hypothetical protein
MSTRQKFILIILSISLVGILAAFALFIMRNPASITSSGIADPVCGTPGDNRGNCDLEISNDLPEFSPAPETAIALVPSLEIESLIIPSVISTLSVSNTETSSPNALSVTPLPCPVSVSGGLVTEMRMIIAAMPRAGSNGFVPPTDAQITGWELLVQAVVDDDLPVACSLIQTYGFPYQLVQFTDAFFEDQQYVMLREIAPVQAGWGTYVFRTIPGATPLVVEVPHPKADWNTEIEGVEIFRKLNARALLVAGAHRCANDTFSPCAGTTIACGQVEPYRVSDVGHGVQNMFHATHRALVDCRSKTVAIQLHGNSVSNCPDVFVSNGTTNPGAMAGNISDRIASSCGDYSVDLADGEAGECAFTGGGAAQAVLTNGCGFSNPPDACTGYTLRPSGPDQFISIEQSLKVRQNFDCLVTALDNIFNP